MIRSIPVSGLIPGTSYSFSVLGIKADGTKTAPIPVIIQREVLGVPTIVSTFTTVDDGKPSQPSAPTVKKPSTSNSTDETMSLIVTHNNKKADGVTNLESDVVSFNVYASTTNGGTYSKIASMPFDKSGSSWATPTITITSNVSPPDPNLISYGFNPYIKVSAVDRSGKESDLSNADRASGDMPTLAAFDELYVRDLTANKIRTGTLSASTSIQVGGSNPIYIDGFGPNIRAGQSAYNNGNGFWMGYDSGLYKFSIGNSAGNHLTYSDDTLSISGSITTTSGTIGGWSIGSSTIYKSYTDGAGTHTITLDSGASTGFPMINISSTNFGSIIVSSSGQISMRSDVNDIPNNLTSLPVGSNPELSFGQLNIYKSTGTSTYQYLSFDSNEIQAITSNLANPATNTYGAGPLSINRFGGNVTIGVAGLNGDTLRINPSTLSIYSTTIAIGTSTNNSTLSITGSINITGNLTISSSTKVTNLNADFLDGLSSGQFLRADTSDTFAGATLTLASGTDIVPAAAATSSLGTSTLTFISSYINTTYTSARPITASISGSGFLGTSTAPYLNIFYVNRGTISDRNIKNSIGGTDLGLDFINMLNPVKYKFNVGDVTEEIGPDGNLIRTEREGVRWHYGFIAQEIRDIVRSLNIDASLFGMADPLDDNSLHHIKPDEFLSPMVKAIQELSSKNDALEARLAALENK